MNRLLGVNNACSHPIDLPESHTLVILSFFFFFFYSSSKSLRPRSSNPPTLNTNFKCTFPRFLFLRMKIKNKYSWIERIPSSLEAGVHAKGRIRCPKKCWREYRLHFGFVPMKNWIGTLHLPVNNSRMSNEKEQGKILLDEANQFEDD